MQDLVNFMAQTHQNFNKKQILSNAGFFLIAQLHLSISKKEKGKPTDTSIGQVYRQSSKVLRKINKACIYKETELVVITDRHHHRMTTKCCFQKK